MNKHILIVGVGRSGTSLLQSIIGTHSEIKTLPETSFIRRFIFNTKALDCSNDTHLDRVPRLKEIVIKNGVSVTDYHKSYMTFLNEAKGLNILDKDPRLLEYITLLKKWFPNTKIIHIHRDPRDVLLSKKRAKWSKGRILLSYLVASRVQLTDANAEKKYAGLYSVKYENLIKEPESEIRKICCFLDLHFESQMMSHEETAKGIVQSEEMSWKKETLEAINKGNSDKWKGQLSNIEALSACLVVKKYCNENGYILNSNECTSFEFIVGNILSSVAILLSYAYRFKRSIVFRNIRSKLNAS